MIYFDVESVGFHGPMVLLQTALDDEEVKLLDVWLHPIDRVLHTIEDMVYHEGGVCAFNLTFDWFHIHRTYNVFSLMKKRGLIFPTKEAWIDLEREACLGPCLKPVTARDPMLVAKKTPLQALMKRAPVYVRRVPKGLAPKLADYLTETITLDGIYFAERKGGYEWIVDPESDDPEFLDVVLRFGASSRLKRLGEYVLGRETISLPTPAHLHPKNVPWNFFHDGWHDLLEPQIEFWSTNEEARRYGKQDVVLLRDLSKHLGGDPGDTNSILACAVASARLRGFALDLDLLSEYRARQEEAKGDTPRAPGPVLEKLHVLLGPIGSLAVTNTDNDALERVKAVGGPAGEFASAVQEARGAGIREKVAEKYLTVGRAHLDFNVSGTLTDRMAGRGKLSLHGTPKGDAMRHAFTLTDEQLPVLDGGDFSGFEVAIAAGCYNDPALSAALATGKSFHGIFAAEVYNTTYEEIVAEKEAATEGKVRYDKAKNAVFAAFYGAQLPKLAATLGLSEQECALGYNRLFEKFPGIKAEQNRTYETFCSMRQPKPKGQIFWEDSQDYAESLLGDKRYFILENQICKALYDLAQDLPASFYGGGKEVERRPGRKQTLRGACQTAIFSCAFQLQAKNMRQAGNHRIQATGARITKELQRAIWEHQPSGVQPWAVQMLNIHDEVLVARRADISLGDTVSRVVESFRGLVPQIKMEWQTDLESWGARE